MPSHDTTPFEDTGYIPVPIRPVVHAAAPDNGLMARVQQLEQQVKSLQVQIDVLRAGLVKHTYLSTQDAHG